MSNRPKPGHFVGMATGMRAAYAAIAEQVDDIKAMDAIERKSAEMTTYSMALALLAKEHGIPPEVIADNLVSCLNDIRRDDGKQEIALHTMQFPTGRPS